MVVGKAVLSTMLAKLGITSDWIDSGNHAGMFSPNRPFSESEWERVNTMLDHIYDDFVGKVAEGRKMTRDQVHEVAKGRIWTGQDACERGLVDEVVGRITPEKDRPVSVT